MSALNFLFLFTFHPEFVKSEGEPETEISDNSQFHEEDDKTNNTPLSSSRQIGHDTGVGKTMVCGVSQVWCHRYGAVYLYLLHIDQMI